MDLEEHLIDLERELLEPATRKNASRLTALLAEDFREFGSSGRLYTRSTILEALAAEAPAEILMADATVQRLAETVALLTCRGIRSDSSQSLRSSVWILREERWQMVFHQGTTITQLRPTGS